MEKNTIISRLIEHYKKAISVISKLNNNFEIISTLRTMCVQKGVCYCSNRLLDVRISGEDWVLKYCNDYN